MAGHLQHGACFGKIFQQLFTVIGLTVPFQLAIEIVLPGIVSYRSAVQALHIEAVFGYGVYGVGQCARNVIQLEQQQEGVLCALYILGTCEDGKTSGVKGAFADIALKHIEAV